MIYYYSTALGDVPTQYCQFVRRRTTGSVAPALSRLENDRLLRTNGIGTRIEHSSIGNYRNVFAGIERRAKGRRILGHQQPNIDQWQILAGNTGSDGEREYLSAVQIVKFRFVLFLFFFLIFILSLVRSFFYSSLVSPSHCTILKIRTYSMPW